MTNEREIIKKLVKIAENQQKIINKMAQTLTEMAPAGSDAMPLGGASGGWEDATAAVTPVVQEAARTANARGPYGVQSAQVGAQSGLLQIKMKHPVKADTKEYYAVADGVKKALMGKPVKTSSGKDVAVTTVEIIGVAG